MAIPKLSKPANRALEAAGFTDITQLSKVTSADLLELHGFGRKSIHVLTEEMAKVSLTFADRK